MSRTYTQQQVVEFLELLDLPSNLRQHEAILPNLECLKVLHTHMISTVPYETLGLHYSPEREVHLDPQHLFQKIVRDGRGRGGYCLENNLLFMFMLRDLGFQVYAAGTKSRLRINGAPKGAFQGWGHIVQIFSFPDGSRWVSDVCFGGDGPTQPMLLAEGSTIRNMGTQDEHKMWQYQYRNNEELPWQTFYCFSDAVEWLPPDFGVVNCFTGSNPESSAVTMLCVVKFLRIDTQEQLTHPQKIYGKRMLVGHLVKENLGGRTRVVRECRTEDDRVQALRDWFNIELTEQEMVSIKGHVTELRS
ncbi:hypothetical protein CSPX01_06839 [Colletotrichum filicis]|nr:hypothetical protein CSPX01_06839 [Colletotrichum filicis]